MSNIAIERINFATAVIIDGKTVLYVTSESADIIYDVEKGLYQIKGKNYDKGPIFVHSTNVQWSKPASIEKQDVEKPSSPGRPRTKAA